MREVRWKSKDLKLGKYDISKARYRELKYFCMQYGEKKALINCGTKTAVRKETALKDIQLIEDTISEVVQDEVMRKCILDAVTNGASYEHINAPCGRRQFYEARKGFFVLLSLKR